VSFGFVLVRVQVPIGPPSLLLQLVFGEYTDLASSIIEKNFPGLGRWDLGDLNFLELFLSLFFLRTEYKLLESNSRLRLTQTKTLIDN
jgi:hypothetical protein